MLERLRELEIAKAEKKRVIVDYYQRHKIEYFGIIDKDMGSKGANPVQKAILEAWEDQGYKVFTCCGANRIGKTTLGSVIALSTLFGKWPWSGKELVFSHNLPRKVRYICQDWEKHAKTVVEPALKEWWPANRKLTTKKNNFGVDAAWIDDTTGSTLELMSNSQEASLHEGWSGDLIVYDEPPRRDIRVANARGLIDRGGRELFCMTLLKEAWVDREVIKAVDENGLPDLSVFNVNGDISVNVGFGITQEGVNQFAKTLTEDEKSARLLGKPSYLSGLIYPQFNRQIHLKERFKVPLHWIVDIAIDVHPRERQAALFIATDELNRKYICDEIWEHGSGAFVGEEVIRFIQRNAYRVGSIIIDPLSKGDKNNPNTVYETIFNILVSHGYGLAVATKDKTAGILKVREYLKSANNEPSLFIFKDLKRTVMEIEGYMYDKDGAPTDADDHMMENLYRALLLETKWQSERNDSDHDRYEDRRNTMTGY